MGEEGVGEVEEEEAGVQVRVGVAEEEGEEEGVEGVVVEVEVEDRGDGQAFLFSKDVFQHGAVFELRVCAVVLNVNKTKYFVLRLDWMTEYVLL